MSTGVSKDQGQPETLVSDPKTEFNDSASVNTSSDGYGSTEEHIFTDPQTVQYWSGIYEKAHYENRHQFDPNYKWTAEEEKKLVRKVGPGLTILF
jgi:hypothetical protein